MLLSIVHKHRGIFLVVLIVSLVFSLPHILIPMQIGWGKYDPLEFFGSSISMEEVYTYVPEVQEILEGKHWVSDTQLFEYKNKYSPYIGETFPAYVMVFLTKIFGSVSGAFVAADIIFPALAVLVVYTLLYVWTRQSELSIVGSLISILFPRLVALLPYTQKMYKEIFVPETYPDFLFFSRNFHPQLSYVLYMMAVLLIWKAISGSKRFYVIVAGIFIGLQFYSYLFSWTSLSLGLIMFSICVLIKRDHRTIKKLFLMGVVAGIVASGYFISSFNFRFSEGGKDFFLRSSSAAFDFIILTFRYIGFLILFSLFFPVRKYKLKTFIISMWLVPVILPIVSQWLLGRNLEGDHWLQRFTMPWTIYGITVIAGIFTERNRITNKWLKLLSTVSIIVILISAVRIQTYQSFQKADGFILNEQRKQLYGWINNNLSPDSVIASLDWETVGTLPAFTGGNNFAPIGIRSIAPTKELQERYLWLFSLYDVDHEFVRLMFTSPSTAGAGELIPRVFYFTYSNDKYLFDVPGKVTDEVANDYLLIKSKVDNGADPPYRLDYVLVSSAEKNIIGENSRIFELEKVLENEKYALYKYN